jgi:hypothetical protein
VRTISIHLSEGRASCFTPSNTFGHAPQAGGGLGWGVARTPTFPHTLQQAESDEYLEFPPGELPGDPARGREFAPGHRSMGTSELQSHLLAATQAMTWFTTLGMADELHRSFSHVARSSRAGASPEP